MARGAREFAVQFTGKVDGSLPRSAGAAQRQVLDTARQARESARQVQQAEAQVARAREGQESAARKVAVAEARLDEIRKSGTAKTSQILAAEDRLASARSRHQSAADKARDASTRLTKAQLDAADASGKMQKGLENGERAASGWSQRMRQGLGTGWKESGRRAGDQYADGVGQGVSLGTAKIRSAVGKTLGAISTGALKAIGGVALAGAGAASALGGVAAVKGFGRLKDIDNARASLDGLGHSAKTVETIMDNALKAVKGTAFGMGAAAKTAAVMVAAGVKPGRDLERTLRLVGDAATIGGTSLEEMGSIFGKVAANQRLSGEEMSQLLDRQIGLLPALADHYGVTAEAARKMVSDGKVSFEEFQIVMEKTVGGAAAKAGQTFEGSMENARAALSRLGAAVLGPVFERLPEVLGGITGELDGLGPLAEQAGEKLGAMFDRAVEWGRDFYFVVDDVWSILSKGTSTGGLKNALGLEDDTVVLGLFKVRDTLQSLGTWARGFWQGLSGDRPAGPLIPGSSIDLGDKFRALGEELAGVVGEAGKLFGSLITAENEDKTSRLGKAVGFLAGELTKLLRALREVGEFLNDENNWLNRQDSFWNSSWVLGGGSIYNQWKNAGKDSVKGYREGMEEGAENEKPAILKIFLTKENGGYGITSAIMDALGISSPSTVFNRFGRWTMQGYREGMESESGGAVSKAAEIFTGIIDRIKRVLGIASPSTVAAGMAQDFIAGWSNQLPGWLTAVSAWTEGLTTKLGEMREGASRILTDLGQRMETLTGKPAKFVVETVINRGLIGAYAAVRRVLPGLPVINEVPLGGLARFRQGGRPDRVPGSRARGVDSTLGILADGTPFVRVDPGEGIVREGAMRSLDAFHPGAFDYINTTGRLPGFFMGGVLPTPGPVRPHRMPYYGAQYAADMGYGTGSPIYAWAPGTVSQVMYASTSYGNRVRINHPNGRQTLYAHMSRISVAPGQQVAAGQRIGDIGYSGNVRPPGPAGAHLHFEILGGAGAIMSQVIGAAQAFFDGVADFTGRIASPMGRLAELGDSPFAQLAAGFPRLMVDGFKARIKEETDRLLLASDSMMGASAGAGWQGNANLLMAAGKQLGLGQRAMQIALMAAAQESSMGTNRTAMSRPNRDGDVGWFQQRFTRGDGTIAQLADPLYALRVFIHGVRSRAGYHVPGLYNIRGWESMGMGAAAQRVQVSAYPTYYDKWAGPAAGWMRAYGYDAGGWLKPGLTLTNNATAKPEAVLTHEQWRTMERLIEELSAGRVMAEPSGDIVIEIDGEAIARVARAEIRADKKARIR